MKTTLLKQLYNKQQLLLKGMAIALSVIVAQPIASNAQDNNNNNKVVRIKNTTESYGHTLNIGLGAAYFGYVGYTVPFLSLNYEINVARDFTLAPSLGFASYRSYNNYFYAGSRYYYHETVMPIGVKGTYYFDRILNAGPNWDFYLAATLGFNIHRVVWDDAYRGDRAIMGERSPLYLDAHIGTEYHVSRGCGIFLDVSTGVSTIGLAVHHL